MATYQVTNLNDEQIGIFLKQKSINADVEQALRRIVAQQHVVAKLEAEAETKQSEIDKIVEDQGRLRENMQALKGSAEERALTQHYTQQLNNQETRIETLQREIEALDNKKEKEQEVLNKMVEELSLEVTL